MMERYNVGDIVVIRVNFPPNWNSGDKIKIINEPDIEQRWLIAHGMYDVEHITTGQKGLVFEEEVEGVVTNE